LKTEIANVKADVLVIGGGLAGCLTALSAREEELDVAIFEKADIRRSGCAGPGLDEAQLVDPDVTISPEKFRESSLKRSTGMVDREIVELYSEWMGESKQRLLELEDYGVKVLKDGKFRLNTQHHDHEIWFEGRNIKPCLAAEVKRRGIRVYNHTMAVGLLKNQEMVVGALGLNIRDGNMVACCAPATAMVTGSATRLYGPLDVGPFLNDYCPSCCGDGHAMAYEAGAKLAGMEFARASIKPVKQWMCRALNHMGAALRTAEGEYLIQPTSFTSPPVSKGGPSLSQQDVICEALSMQIHGKQLFWDATDIPEEKCELLRFGMENEKPISLKFCEDVGFDFQKHPMEAQVILWNFHAGFAGVVVNKDMRTTLDGLYAVGDVAGGTGVRLGAMMCVVYAHRLGKLIARYVEPKEPVEPEHGQVEAMAGDVLSPLELQDGYRPLDVEKLVQHIVNTYAGILRSGVKLSWGLKELKRVKREILPKICAVSPHDLMRAFEARCLTTVSEMHMRAALFRNESRMAPMHYRIDHPREDDANWKSTVITIRKRDGEMVLEKTRLNAGWD